MRSEDLRPERGWTEADFQHRAEPASLPEWMDEPCPPDVLAACLRDLEKVNRLTLSYRPTLRFLARVASRHPGRELHLLDVGSGYGDMLRAIHRWASRRRLRLRLTGIDLNPHTESIARQASAAAGIPDHAIQWKTGDAMTSPHANHTHPPDIIISSLMTHHLPSAEIPRFLRWMEATSPLGWFINDLERQRVPARLFGLLARTGHWHPFVQHDGPVSFRRAFRVSDWQALLHEAHVPTGAATVVRAFPARLCVERLR